MTVIRQSYIFNTHYGEGLKIVTLRQEGLVFTVDVCVTSFWTNTINTHDVKSFKTRKGAIKYFKEKVK